MKEILFRNLNDVLTEVQWEVVQASRKHKPMNSAHEGYAVLKEEVDELWDEIKHKQQNHRLMRKEAIQVAAMAIRLIHDVIRVETKEPQ